MSLTPPIWSKLLTRFRDNKWDEFMEPILYNFNVDFSYGFSRWLATNKDNYSTRGFLMAGPQNEGAPNP